MERKTKYHIQEGKKSLMKKPIVKVFDPKKEIVLTTDESELAVSTILSQDSHPFMYLSRKINFGQS